jgi:transposase InsO family protein
MTSQVSDPIEKRFFETFNLAPSEIQIEQRKDEAYAHIIQYLEDGTLPTGKTLRKEVLDREADYVLIHGLLYRLSTAKSIAKHDPSAQLVVPRVMRNTLLQLSHASTFGGHLGPGKLLAKLRPYFHWAGISKDVTQFCESCVECLEAKTAIHTKAPMTLRDYTPSLFHTLQIDHMVGLPKTSKGNTAICMTIDVFSKYLIAWPTKSLSAEALSHEFYTNVCCVIGAPNTLCSDNGTCFTANMFQNMCTSFGIKQIFSSSYCPRTQGQIERQNRVVKTALRTYIKGLGKDWDEYLQPVIHAINTSEVYSTGLSPFLLVHGQQARNPVSALLPDSDHQARTVQENFSHLVERMHKVRQEAYESIKKTQSEMQQRYNKHTKDPIFKVGDIVFVKKETPDPGKGKLSPKYKGPYLIIEMTTKNTARLKRLADDVILNKSVNISRIKMANGLKARVKNAHLQLTGKQQPKSAPAEDTRGEQHHTQAENFKWTAPKSPDLPGKLVLHPVTRISRATKLDNSLYLELQFLDGDRRWLPFSILHQDLQEEFTHRHGQGSLQLTTRPHLRGRVHAQVNI